MKLRHLVILSLASLSLAGCKKREPAPGPTRPAVNVESTDADARTAEETRRRDEERRRGEDAARERGRVRAALSEVVFFEYDSFEISPESESRLRAKAEILRENPSVRIRVEGHADQRGSTEYNLVLGQKRAEAVRDFLVGYGISDARVATLSYGKEQPLEYEEGEAAWARNRRAEFIVLGGMQ